MGRPKFALTEKCLNHHGAMVWLVAIESSVLHLRMPDLFANIYKGEGSLRTPYLYYVINGHPLLTTTKSTCGCKDDKDECDTEKNPVWDRAALQCFQQIIWFTLEKFYLYFDHFESFELPSPEGQGPLLELGALLFFENSVWPPFPQGLDPLWAVGASLASSFKALLFPFSRTTVGLLRIA